MRRRLLASLTLIGWLSAAPAFAACDLSAPDALGAGQGDCGRLWADANLRLDQIQIVGTAESYKLAPTDQLLSLIRMGGKAGAQALDFGQPALSAQLDLGARSLEFDIAADPAGGLYKHPAGASMAGELLDPAYVARMSEPGVKVIHVFDVDYRSSCLTLKDCLTEVLTWSRTHPRHLPFVIVLHTNDRKTSMPGATRPAPFDGAAFERLDALIRSLFEPRELIVPDDVKGAYPSLRAAVAGRAWPKLAEARGKTIFLLDDTPAKVALYTQPASSEAPSLQGKPMFVTVNEDSPLASFLSIEDPIKDLARIESDVAAGFIVKTRADRGTREARQRNMARRDTAFSSGAQIVVTDFLLPDRKIGDYQVKLAGPARCDTKTAGNLCAGVEFPARPAAQNRR
ncbi:MAG: Ca2+-dependent phosphoinositide-specific phospholipase C [Rhizomicrobium sp.]